MGTVVAFAGLLLPVESLRPLQLKIAEVRTAFGIPDGVEIKWSPHKDSWIYQNLHNPERTECYRQMLRATCEANATAFVVCIDIGERVDSKSTALRKCIDWCFERVTMCLERRNSLAVIVCDRPGGGKKEEDALLTDVLATIETGTDFVKPTQIPLNILTTPSHLVTELQLSDLVAGVTTAMVAGDVPYAEPVFEEIRPMFHKNILGYVGGTGLKVYPDSLTNLYHWVCGETAFTKARIGMGYSLPWWEWPYATSGSDPNRLATNPRAIRRAP